MKNQVSIILPNYNSSQTIMATVNSILKQSYSDWELIIIDDCSNHETKKILSKLKNKKIKIFYLKKIEAQLIAEILELKNLIQTF